MSKEMARVIRPLSIGPAQLVSSDVLEDDYTAWVAGTYAVDTWVRHNHKVWQALKETTKEPGVAGSEYDWNDGGATNRWKLTDKKVGSQTVRTGGMVYEFQVNGFVDSIAVLNIIADSVRITMTDPVEGVVFQQEAVTLDAGVANWWQYFFKPIRRRKDVIIDGLPPYAGVVIKVELITGPTTDARLGDLVLGSRFDIGYARWGSSVGIRDFTQKSEDDYGNLQAVEGAWSKRPEFDLIIDTNRVDYVMEELALLRAIPCVYIGHRRHTMTIAYGYYRELMTVLANPSTSDCVLTIEALT